ncbi:glycosyltransferase family 2 protein, partial [bacterium]|nr:glycosyltransferase family 2 protein [bacterium]
GAPSKLHSFKDGWRHLRYMMLYKPMPFLFVPGALAFVTGLLLNAAVLVEGHVETLRLHSLILGSLLLVIGVQTIAAAIYMKAYGVLHGLYENKGLIKKLLDWHSLEREGMLGIIFIGIGIALGVKVLLSWIYGGYGELAEVESAVASMIFSIIGIQIIFTAIFISVMLSERGGNGNTNRV